MNTSGDTIIYTLHTLIEGSHCVEGGAHSMEGVFATYADAAESGRRLMLAEPYIARTYILADTISTTPLDAVASVNNRPESEKPVRLASFVGAVPLSMVPLPAGR